MKIIGAIPGFILLAAAVWIAILNIVTCIRGYVRRRRGDTRSYTLAPGVTCTGSHYIGYEMALFWNVGISAGCSGPGNMDSAAVSMGYFQGIYLKEKKEE
jgi:hypothetical protein